MLLCGLLIRSHDGQLLVVSSTDGYCTLITFDENELGTIYKKLEAAEVAPALSPVKPVLLPVKPAYQAVECLSEAKNENATTKKEVVVQSAPVTDPVHGDHSPQRKKARRVVLQTLSTNVEDFTKSPCELTSGVTEVTKNVVVGEKCRQAASAADVGGMRLCIGRDSDFSQTTNSEVTNNYKPECVEVCGDMQVTEVGPDLYSLLEQF